MESGLTVDTPEYFRFLDKQMGYQTVNNGKKATPKPSGRPRVAAPGGTRSAPANGALKDIALSRAEIQIARSMGLSNKEYAAQKKEIILNGQNPERGGPRYSNQTQANRR